MIRATRRLIALTVVFTASLAVPAAAQEQVELVARVGDRPITVADYDRWLVVAVKSASGGGRVLDPPTFERCVASQRKPRVGRPRPTADGARDACERRYRSLRRQAMRFVVQAAWVREEAGLLGIVVTRRQARKVFERQWRSAFSTRREFRGFQRETGQTGADILYRVRIDLLQQRIAARARPDDPEALFHLAESLRERWKAQTACVEELFIAECGSVLPPEPPE